jgi:hypothetical protein
MFLYTTTRVPQPKSPVAPTQYNTSLPLTSGNGGHEQLISNGGRFKPAFARRDKKQAMLDLRGISTNWFKNQLIRSTRLSRLRAWVKNSGSHETPYPRISLASNVLPKKFPLLLVPHLTSYSMKISIPVLSVIVGKQ